MSYVNRSISYREESMSVIDWKDEDCDAVDALLTKLSSKHALPILAILSLRGRQSFGQLRRELIPISPKVLSGCLNQLQTYGFVVNDRELQGRVQKSYYSVTEKDKFVRVFASFREVAKAS